MYCVYFLRNSVNRLYIGQTDDLQRRLIDHQSSHGAKFIKDYGNFKLVYMEQFETRAEAMKRENQLKKWSRAKKEALIIGDFNLLQKLSRSQNIR
ncbi:GIY-YIG nuclease family protein [Candidatus Parcubacteria bacterium]|nr:GIY-YIG nuclease family protein [Candidatus Parcubacteria bacterium]